MILLDKMKLIDVKNMLLLSLSKIYLLAALTFTIYAHRHLQIVQYHPRLNNYRTALQ